MFESTASCHPAGNAMIAKMNVVNISAIYCNKILLRLLCWLKLIRFSDAIPFQSASVFAFSAYDKVPVDNTFVHKFWQLAKHLLLSSSVDERGGFADHLHDVKESWSFRICSEIWKSARGNHRICPVHTIFH